MDNQDKLILHLRPLGAPGWTTEEEQSKTVGLCGKQAEYWMYYGQLEFTDLRMFTQCEDCFNSEKLPMYILGCLE